ncbi:hypothetical protein [Larkinella terrae]|uniref:DUF4595 domain-containing protein n=1 Tax=Larkinella terrae TaxID=2025311 RepID=A0A7K0EPQ4_9BACT|nr:hypothetical protein [Larkinella terrae]MRS63541.1 hypothetical protein [Larkinella terrae]
MNFLTKCTAAALCVLLGLSSCENTELAPAETAAPETELPTSNSEESASRKPLFLKKLDARTLTYFQGGKLRKVTHSPSQYSEFEYGPNWVSSTLFINQKREQKQTFLLNDKGNCIESYLYSYDSQGITATLQLVHEYAYDAANKLIRINRKNTPNDRKLFFYDANGDLSRVECYNASNVKTGENTYSYELPGVARQVDHDPINTFYGISTQGEFLNVFGKTNKHLLRRYSFKNMYTNQVVDEKILYYTLNSNGYAANYTQFDVEANVMLPGKVSYEYTTAP